MKTYLLVSKKYPYQAYAVGDKEYVEKIAQYKKYRGGYFIREAIDEHDGCYRIDYVGGMYSTVGYRAFQRALLKCHQEGLNIKFIGTQRDWLKMHNSSIPIQDSIRGFGRDISQKWSKELYKTEL